MEVECVDELCMTCCAWPMFNQGWWSVVGTGFQEYRYRCSEPTISGIMVANACIPSSLTKFAHLSSCISWFNLDFISSTWISWTKSNKFKEQIQSIPGTSAPWWEPLAKPSQLVASGSAQPILTTSIRAKGILHHNQQACKLVAPHQRAHTHTHCRTYSCGTYSGIDQYDMHAAQLMNTFSKSLWSITINEL